MPPNYQAPAPRLGWAIGGLILATCLVYLNSLTGPFVFDDQSAILENPTIRRLGSLGDVLSPHLDGGLTISGRPVVNLSLALNYAWGGYGVMGYHLFNLLVHGLAGLTLFGLLRRTLAGRLPSSPLAGAPGNRFAGTRWSENALGLAFFTTLLWLVHPLQTSAVTYVVQRAELLMALCYLLTLYSFLRGVSAVHPGRWLILSWCACLVGMACKEVMATAPLMQQVVALSAVAIGATVLVYGLVAGIVKLDDLGLALHRQTDATARAMGAFILRAAPLLMKSLSVLGTAAMFTVGGSIIAHGVPAIEHFVEGVGHSLTARSTALAFIGTTVIDALVGLVSGAMAVMLFTGAKKVAGKAK